MEFRLENALFKNKVVIENHQNRVTKIADQLFTGVSYNIECNEININTDSGRIMNVIFKERPDLTKYTTFK